MPGRSSRRKGYEGKTREADVLRAVRERLRAMGFFVVRIQQGLGCHRGMPDLLAVRDGRVLWIECKRPGGRLSEAQRQFCQELEAHGGVYVVATGADDLLEVIRCSELTPAN